MREVDDDCSVGNGFATAFAVQACNLKRGADVVIAACPSEPVRGLAQDEADNHAGQDTSDEE